MRLTVTLALLLALGGAEAAKAGDRLPQVELTGFTNTGATDVSDFSGRLLMIEFFAYW